MMYGDHGAWGVGEWLAMGVMMVVLWGLLVAFVVLLVRGFRNERGPSATSRRWTAADALLAERYARGEIDDEEFTHRLEALHAGDQGS